MDRLDQLIEAAIDGTADAAAWEELGGHLQQPEGRRRVAEAMRLCGGIAQLRRPASGVRRRWPRLLLAAGLVVGLGLVGLASVGGPDAPPGARIVAAGPAARILGPQPRPAQAGMIIAAEESLSGPGSVALPDGSLCHLSATAELRFTAVVGALELVRGQVEVQAEPQAPGRRLTVRTTRLEAAVHGTRFAVDVGADDDVVAVHEGRVQVAVAGQQHEVGVGGVLRSDGTTLRSSVMPPATMNYDLGAPTVPVLGVQHPDGLAPRFDHLAGEVRMHLLRVGGATVPLAALKPDSRLGLLHDLPAETPAVLVVGVVRATERKGWVGNLRASIILPAGRDVRTDWDLASMRLASGEALPALRGDEAIDFVMILTPGTDAGLRLRRIDLALAPSPALVP